MKKSSITLVLLMFAFSIFSFESKAQVAQMIGTWKTIDDETGQAKSYVKIFKATDGYYYGKITQLLTKPADTKCTECKGNLKDKPVVGMIIVKGMKPDGKDLEDGKILDPGNGKYYYCSMTIDEKDKNKLNVRGSLDSWGIAGRNQTWYRVIE